MSVFIQDTFLFMPSFIYTHRLIIAITQTAPKVSSKIIPIDSCAVYSCTMFLFVSFIILFIAKLRTTYLSVQILHSRSPGNQDIYVICLWRVRNYHNNPYITDKRMLSAVRSNSNYLYGANGWRVIGSDTAGFKRLKPLSFSALFSLKTKLLCCCAHARLLLKTLLYAGQYLFIVSCSNRGNRIRF